jgi:hypothetical protein
MSDVTEREMQAGGLPWSEPISLSVSVMLEGWTDSGAPGLGPMGNPLREGVLDLQARSWAEYGPNRGAEHILRVFKRFRMDALANARIPGHEPTLSSTKAKHGQLDRHVPEKAR